MGQDNLGAAIVERLEDAGVEEHIDRCPLGESLASMVVVTAAICPSAWPG